jgi:hypothetical protein
MPRDGGRTSQHREQEKGGSWRNGRSGRSGRSIKAREMRPFARGSLGWTSKSRGNVVRGVVNPMRRAVLGQPTSHPREHHAPIPKRHDPRVGGHVELLDIHGKTASSFGQSLSTSAV